MYQKMTHTLEDLKKLAAMELRDVNREELVDINDVEIKKDLSQRERMVDFVSQIKNPYHDIFSPSQSHAATRSLSDFPRPYQCCPAARSAVPSDFRRLSLRAPRAV